jgi:hypothetical protein
MGHTQPQFFNESEYFKIYNNNNNNNNFNMSNLSNSNIIL